MKAHIFDTSNYLYAGGYYNRREVSTLIREDNGAYRGCTMPVSSITYLLNEVVNLTQPDVEMIFVFDSPPTIKRQLYGELFGNYYGYKAGRQEKPAWFEPCKQLAMESLMQMGFHVLCKEEYEADDLIASWVKYNRNSYEHIYVHTRDSDLIHLVSDNVTIEKCGNAGKHVDVRNYSSSIKNNYNVNYNLAVVSRLCFNVKDNVPLVPKEYRQIINTGIPKDMWDKCGNIKLLRHWVEQLTEGNKTVMGIYDLVTPIILPGEEVELYDSNYDKRLMEFYFSKFGCSYDPSGDSELGEETIRKYIEMYSEEGGK